MNLTDHGWRSRDTTTHQDHVIAHVIGTTALGYFVFNEAVYLLLDIGFVWSIFLDGEMGLMPHPVAFGELDVNECVRTQIRSETDHLLGNLDVSAGSLEVIQALETIQITEVNFYEQGSRRRLIIAGENANLAIETCMATAEIKVYDI